MPRVELKRVILLSQLWSRWNSKPASQRWNKDALEGDIFLYSPQKLMHFSLLDLHIIGLAQVGSMTIWGEERQREALRRRVIHADLCGKESKQMRKGGRVIGLSLSSWSQQPGKWGYAPKSSPCYHSVLPHSSSSSSSTSGSPASPSPGFSFHKRGSWELESRTQHSEGY